MHVPEGLVLDPSRPPMLKGPTVEQARTVKISLRRLIMVLLALPVLYGLVAYAHVAWWHGKLWLLDTVIHENGRLTLLQSLFYFDHFLACVPMVVFFALCAAGGFALGAPISGSVAPGRARFLATNMLLPLPVFLTVAFAASVRLAGWQRTLDYSLQWIERDGVMSPGGSWNQLQLSNLPIALGTIATAFALGLSWSATRRQRPGRLSWAGLAFLAVAFAFGIGLTVVWWPGWEAFLNPRWLAHSVREHATYPLTAIPIALACILATHAFVTRQPTPSTSIALRLPLLTWMLLAGAVVLLAGQLLVLRQTDVLTIAQTPPFAPEGLSISYLLASHVFEHFLDFLFIVPLSAGLYAFLVWLSLLRYPRT